MLPMIGKRQNVENGDQEVVLLGLLVPGSAVYIDACGKLLSSRSARSFVKDK